MFRKVSPETKLKAIELYEKENKTLKEISLELGYSTASIGLWVNPDRYEKAKKKGREYYMTKVKNNPVSIKRKNNWQKNFREQHPDKFHYQQAKHHLKYLKPETKERLLKEC